VKGVARSTTAPRGAARWWLTGHAGLVYAFFYAPIAVLVFYSFNDSRIIGGFDGFTLRWYRDLSDDQRVIDALMVSLKVALASTVISVVLGTMAALSIERFRWRGRRSFDAVLYLPIIIPDVTMAVMLLVFFSEAADLLSRLPFIDLSSGLDTLVLAHVAFNISFVSVVVRARLANLDPSIEEAAADLYANRWQAFRRVTLPQIMPGVVGGALIAITLSLDDVVISSFVHAVGSTPLPVYVFGLVRRGVTPLINAVSVLMLAISLTLVLVSLVVQRISSSPSPDATKEPIP
jgi:spermidine/putrescine transport system permease protein